LYALNILGGLCLLFCLQEDMHSYLDHGVALLHFHDDAEHQEPVTFKFGCKWLQGGNVSLNHSPHAALMHDVMREAAGLSPVNYTSPGARMKVGVESVLLVTVDACVCVQSLPLHEC
jgi:hypothetical protein